MERRENSDEEKRLIDEVTREVDEYMQVPNPQITHVRASLERIKNIDIKNLTWIVERMKDNIAYSFLFEKIVYLKTDSEVIEDDTVEWSEGKMGHLEPLRKGCLNWWETNKDKYIK